MSASTPEPDATAPTQEAGTEPVALSAEALAEAVARFPGRYAATRRFSIGVPRNVTVVDGPRVLFLRSKDGNDPTLCLWSIDLEPDADAGTDAPVERLLVDPTNLGIDESDLPAAERARRERARESAGGIVGYGVDRAGRKACFVLAGSLFVVELDSGSVTALAVGGSVFDPRLDPDGTRIAYVSGNDLGVVDLDTGESQVVARAVVGEGPVSWGRAEFIAAEEMQRGRGFWWSPAGDQLLVTMVDESQVQQWWIADPAHPDRPPTETRYPAAGTANARVELHLVDLDGARRRIDWDDNNRFEYLANVVWSGEHPPVLVRQTRDQRQVSMAEVDLDTLAVRERHLVTEDTWVELIPGSPTLGDGRMVTIEDLTPAANDPDPAGPGRRALVVDGRPVTGPALNVRSLVGLVEGRVLVTAWTEPTEIHLLSIDPSGAAQPVALTTEPGVHGAAIGARSDDGSVVVVVTASSPEQQQVRVTAHRLGPDDQTLSAPLATIADLATPSPLPALPTFHQLGPDRLESALFLPSDYDGQTALPVLLDPYGGPHAQRVLKHHTPHLVSQWFAEQGFAVLVSDGRGTPGRGPTWERQVWGDLAAPVLADQVEALDAAADEYDILDLDRVAIRGWSFGGYLAALAVLRRPDRFHAAIAGAPVTTWRLYDTHYTERYLGRPDLHPLHYQRTDLLAEAERLTQPLLLIHGLADDNVVAAHTLRLSTAFLAAGAPHQVLPLSGVTHMTPQEVVAENLLWLQLEFLRRSLGIRSGP